MAAGARATACRVSMQSVEPVGSAWAHGEHATAAVWGRKLIVQGQGSVQWRTLRVAASIDATSSVMGFG